MEPGNPLHISNYQQVVSQIGGSSSPKLISAEEAAVIVDELEATAPSIHQHYSDAVALAVRSALTDAELFISYNMPAKALGPLMAALPQAPNDLRLNQRLAALHTRAARFAEASVCCRTLQNIYSDAGYPDEATRYGELAGRYEERSAASAVAEPIIGHAMPPAAPEGISVASASSVPWPAIPPEAEEEAEFAVVSDSDGNQEVQLDDQGASVDEAPAAPAEIDLSSEWDDTITIDADSLPAESAENEVAEPVGGHVAPAAKLDPGKRGKTTLSPEKTNEAVEEIRFYLEHGMPEQASAAFEKLRSLCDDEATLDALRAEIAASSEQSPPVAEVTTVEAVSEFATDEPQREYTIDEISADVPDSAAIGEQASLEPPVPAGEAHTTALHDAVCRD